MRSNASASCASTLTSSCSSARNISLRFVISIGAAFHFVCSEDAYGTKGDGTKRSRPANPSFSALAQRATRTVCSRDFFGGARKTCFDVLGFVKKSISPIELMHQFDAVDAL